MKTIIENVRFFQDGTMVFGDLYLENGYVERIDYKTPRGLSDLAIPGFIDIHTHGFHMISCEETDPKMLQELSLEYVKRGTTSFCATLRCKSLNDYAKQLDIYKEAFKDFRGGARYLGAHLEGPHLSDNMIMSEQGEKTICDGSNPYASYVWNHCISRSYQCFLCMCKRGTGKWCNACYTFM